MIYRAILLPAVPSERVPLALGILPPLRLFPSIGGCLFLPLGPIHGLLPGRVLRTLPAGSNPRIPGL